MTGSPFVQALRAEALRLASEGFKVIPVASPNEAGVCTCARGPACASPGKHPLFAKWREGATDDPNVIATWPWSSEPNLGLVPEEQLVVLDFDGTKGRRALEGLMTWCPQLQTGRYAFFRTGSGGFHLIGRGKAPDRVRVLAGMDVRGMRGQAVVPPSRHYSGRSYEVIVPLTRDVERFPDEVIDLVTGKGEPPPELRLPEIVTADDIQALSRKGKHKDAFKALSKGEPFAQPGQRDTVLTAMVGTLATKFATADPQQVAQLFTQSLAAMSIYEGAPSVADVVNKFQKFASVEQQRKKSRGVDEVRISTCIPEMAVAGVEALGRCDPARLYRRGGELVFVTHNDKLPDLSIRVEEPPRIRSVSSSFLLGELSAVASWIRKVDGVDVNKLPPPTVAAYVVEYGEWPQVACLEAVVSGAFLRSDGTICLGGRFDESTGVLSVRRAEYTQPYDKRTALDMLEEVFCDFPLKSGHYPVVLAAILTGVGRFAFPGPSPMFLFDANVRGAGKSLVANVVGLIVSAGGAIGAGVGTDNEEDRKQITSHAMAGTSVLLADNVTGQFGTAKLCEALTLHDGIWSDRVLGRNTTWSGSFRPLWMATGNNVALRADMMRRICYCRLESPHERPEERAGFKHPALMGYVAERREELYWAALSVLRRFFEEGASQPPDMKPWGGYEGWSSVIRAAVMWAGYEDPYDTHDEMTLASDDFSHGQVILDGVQALSELKGGPIKCSDVIEALYGFGSLVDGVQEQFGDLREVLEAMSPFKTDRLIAGSIGKIFKKYRERVIDGRVLRSAGRHNREWLVVAATELL